MSPSIARRRRIHKEKPAVPPAIAAAVTRALAAVAPVRPDKALPLLQQIQAELGYLPADALEFASQQSHIPLADLNGLVSFYDRLTTDPDGATVIHLCDDLVCRSASGARELAQRLAESGQKVRFGPCLGQCDVLGCGFLAPGMLAHPDVASEATDLAANKSSLLGGAPEKSPAKARRWPEGYRAMLLTRCGQYDPANLKDYGRHGGLKALDRALAMSPADLVGLIKTTRLVGRGGAAFPTGLKWEGVLNAPTPYGPGPDGARRYVVVNGDESEPGTFTNRVLMEQDPLGVVEAALIAAHGVGADQVYFYIRGEYPQAIKAITDASRLFQEAGLVGHKVLSVRAGGGRYVCGEETALFASIEGERGMPRIKPPFPTTNGLFHRPTLINNVETLMNVIAILNEGVAAWNTAEPKLFSISGHLSRPGVYEVPMTGTSLADLLALAGGPTGTVQAVLMGGASGMFLGPEQLGTPLTYPGMAAAGATLGSGAVMVFDQNTDLWDVARRATRFFAEESCGKCVPCRLGTARQEELVERMAAGEFHWVPLFDEMSGAMTDSSICGLGQTATNLVRSLLRLKGVH